MDFAIKFAFDILAFTSVMVLIVLGLGVIASMMGIFNFAHGELVLLGAYTVYLCESTASAPGPASWRRRSCVGLVGLVLERTIIRRFYAVPIIAMLGTYAIGLDHPRDRARIARRALQVDPGADQRRHSAQVVSISPSGVAFVIVTTMVVIAGSWLLLVPNLGRSACARRVGKPDAGARMRHFDARLYALTFAFGAALAGLAGALIVPLYQLSADIGIRFLVQAFLSVMLGGVGTFEGPVLGAGRGRRHGGRPAVGRHSGTRRPARVRDCAGRREAASAGFHYGRATFVKSTSQGSVQDERNRSDARHRPPSFP